MLAFLGVQLLEVVVLGLAFGSIWTSGAKYFRIPANVILILVAVSGILILSGSAEAQAGVDELEQGLSEAGGRERLGLLMKLISAPGESDPARVITHVEEALELLEGSPDTASQRLELLQILGHAGRAHTRLGQFEAAIETYRRALQLASETAEPTSDIELQLELSEKLSEAFASAGLHEEALATLRDSEDSSRQIFERDAEGALAEMRFRFETQEQQQEIELLNEKGMLADLELERQRDVRRMLALGFVLVLTFLLLWVHRSRLASRATAMQETMERERAVNERLREVDQVKDEFLANTSYELKTPLCGITGLAESLIEGAAGELPSAAQTSLSLMVASGRRLTSLVDNLLDFSKLEHHSLELQRTPVELHALADVVLTLLAPLLKEKDVELRNRIGGDLPPVSGDENRLQQILYNLVGNAIKFTATGSIDVSAEPVGEHLAVRVADTGIGISAADQKRIFEAFEQVDASAERRFGGTGLGLALTRQLVELHGGALTVESALGEGSTFTFTLPIADSTARASRSREAVAAAPRAKIHREMPVSADPPRPVTVASGSPGEDGPAPAPMRLSGTVALPERPARILLVDDEPINLQVLSTFLIREGFEVLTASSGEEALELASSGASAGASSGAGASAAGEEGGRFDLVLLDIMMPKISGYQVCRALRETYAINELPIIFFTAKNQDPDVVTGMALGANDYLTKPIRHDRLLARVRSHLELLEAHRRLDRQVRARMAEHKVLSGLLPICSSCRRIRDDEGYWSQLEMFISDRSEASFSHGICPECMQEHYGDLLEDGDSEPSTSPAGLS